MRKLFSRITSGYDLLVLRQPVATLIALCALIAYFLVYIPDFELDASADSLVLENDSSLKYYRSIRERYGSDDFLIVTYTPDGELFSQPVLDDIASLRDALAALEQVDSVVSLLDVPLVDSPPMSLAEISRGVRTLQSDDADVQLAEREMRSSALPDTIRRRNNVSRNCRRRSRSKTSCKRSDSSEPSPRCAASWTAIATGRRSSSAACR
jgi:predicted RND superfamily exporter protein